MSLNIQIPVAGASRPMPGYIARPEGKGPHPAVIVFEEIFGVNAHIRDVTDRVAREGYVAIAPDIHHRHAPGQQLGYDEAGFKAGMPLIGKLTAEGLAADIQATLAVLRGRDDVRSDRIGCMGFCIGGHAAYFAACTADVKATASFYGGGITALKLNGVTTVSRTSGIRGKILCLFGGKDAAIPQDQVDTIRNALKEHKIRHEVVVYPEADHGFFCDQRASYNPAAARDAWDQVKRLFAEELR